MGPFRVNESASSRTAAEQEEDDQLRAARAAFPGHDIVETFGGYLAVPMGTAIIQASTLGGLVSKLRMQE